MTVTNTNNKVVFVGDGATLIFAYTFRIFVNADLVVTISDTSVTPQVDTVLTLDQDYTVSGAGSPSGGNVTLILGGSSILTVAPPATDNITLLRTLPLTQNLDLIENDDFPSQSTEDELDKGVFIDQQLLEQIARSINIPANISGVSVDLPAPVANFILGWNAGATALINIDPATIAASTIPFLSLPDTPASYAGSALFGLRVNAGATAVEFAAIAAADVTASVVSFDDGDLTAGILTHTHNLSEQYPVVQIYDNNNLMVIPDEITATSTSVSTIDLSSFGTITGTWRCVAQG